MPKVVRRPPHLRHREDRDAGKEGWRGRAGRYHPIKLAPVPLVPMPCWYSPWPVAPTLDAHLQAAGLTRFGEPTERLPGDALVLYSPLDALLAAEHETASVPQTAQQLVEDYARLQSWSSRRTLMATWRAEALDPESIRQWLLNAAPLQIHRSFPQPEPLTALLTKTLLDMEPRLLEAYLDLELVAELGGGAPDSGYAQRIAAAAADPQRLLENWWVPRQRQQTSLQNEAALIARADALEKEKQQAHEERDLLRTQLHHVQEELERLGVAEQSNASQMQHLQDVMESQTVRINGLEAELLQIRYERDGLLESREALSQERDRLTQERDALLQNQNALGQERNALSQERELLTHERDALLRNLDGISQERDLLSQEKVLLSQQKDSLAQERDALLLNRDGLTQERDLLSQERDSLTQEREAIAQERDAVVLEKVVAVATMAGLNHQLAGQTEALRLAREAEAQHQARAQALEDEKRQACEAKDHVVAQLHELQEELERLFLSEHTKEARIGQLLEGLETQSARVSVLEAELLRIRNERDGALQERDAIAEERNVVVQEKQIAVTKLADLNHQLAGQTEALRLAREAHAHQLARAQQALESNQQQDRQAAERLQGELTQLRGELERLVGVNEHKTIQLGQLQHTLEAQTARVSVLETDLLRIRSERDQARQERDVVSQERDGVAQEKSETLSRMADLNRRLSEQTEALRLAREAAAQQLARAGALEGEKWQAREEVRRMMMQLHQLQEELENSFLQSQAGDQLIAAQQEQLRRAQSLMTRLLVQTTGGPPPMRAVAVEVLPPERSDSSQRSLPSGGSERPGWGSGLLRKVWPR